MNEPGFSSLEQCDWRGVAGLASSLPLPTAEDTPRGKYADQYAAAKARYDCEGRCRSCGGTPKVTATLCGRCRDAVRIGARRHRDKRLAAGLCVECRNPPNPAEGKTLRCAECKARIKAKLEAKQRAAGVPAKHPRAKRSRKTVPAPWEPWY